jgi:hypothetical protein
VGFVQGDYANRCILEMYDSVYTRTANRVQYLMFCYTDPVIIVFLITGEDSPGVVSDVHATNIKK